MAVFLLSPYFQLHLVTELPFNNEVRGSIRPKTWFVIASFKGGGTTECVLKSPSPRSRLLCCWELHTAAVHTDARPGVQGEGVVSY